MVDTCTRGSDPNFDYNFSVLILSLTKVNPRLQKNLLGIDVDIDQNVQIYCAWVIQGDSLVILDCVTYTLEYQLEMFQRNYKGLKKKNVLLCNSDWKIGNF